MDFLLARCIALAAGYILDLLCGDPRWLPHPIVAIGKGISFFEKILRKLFPQTPAGEKIAGTCLAFLMPAIAFGLVFGLLYLAGIIHPLLRLGLETFWCYQILATKSLKDASLRVYKALADGDLTKARAAVGMIVGRETDALSETEVIRATVETVAENTSDGVVAPLLFFLLGGAPLAMAYKAINTMDSMVGYKNKTYLYFGWAPAHLDDIANFIPARLTALLIILASHSKQAWRVWKRDKRKHLSPNAGHPEAACAGALGVQLGGDSCYHGKLVKKSTLGDDLRPLEATDIQRINRILYIASFLCVLFCSVILVSLFLWKGATL